MGGKLLDKFKEGDLVMGIKVFSQCMTTVTGIGGSYVITEYDDESAPQKWFPNQIRHVTALDVMEKICTVKK